MTHIEVIKHEGLDGRTWYVIFQLFPYSQIRDKEILRTTKLSSVLTLLNVILSEA
jgi:hypothetical protein